MKEKEYDAIIQIENCLISGDVITEFFCCDYEKCKGVCCIIGDSGAPLEENEIEEIEKNYPFYAEGLSEEAREIIDKKGFFDIDIDGDLVTPLCSGEECVFTKIMPDKSCRCEMEWQYLKGKGSFRKPISCQLYPIRVSKLSNGMDALNLHRWHICKDAYIKGKKEGLRVYEFLREPLIRLYGEEFYSALSELAKSLIASS